LLRYKKSSQVAAFFMALVLVRALSAGLCQFYGLLIELFPPLLCAIYFSLELKSSNKNHLRFSSAILKKKW
jgi:hypothetical protein